MIDRAKHRTSRRIIDNFINVLDDLGITIAEKVNDKNVPGLLNEYELDALSENIIRGLNGLFNNK